MFIVSLLVSFLLRCIPHTHFYVVQCLNRVDIMCKSELSVVQYNSGVG